MRRHHAGSVSSTGPPGREEEAVVEDVAFLEQALERDLRKAGYNDTGKPLLVLLSGLPGTGKSYFARQLSRRCPFLIISSDRVRKALVSTPRYTRGEHARVFAACHALVERHLARGFRVVFDATNLTEGHRRPLYKIARQWDVPVEVVYFTAEQGTVRQRLEERAAGYLPASHSDADWRVYRRLVADEEPVEGPHFTVDTSEDFSHVLEEIARRGCQ